MAASKKAAAVLLLALAGCRGDSPAERMRATAGRAERTVEARLTGFNWSAMRVQRAGREVAPLDPARLELAGAAGAVIERTSSSHDSGVGYLMIDRDADAVEALQEAARQSPGNAAIWSDLAAARYTLAVRGNKPYELPPALAAADRALLITPAFPDALFNRALIIERLGISEAARHAWQRYLQTDGNSKWSDEALAHLGRLDVTTTDAEFRREFARATAALTRGDAAPLGALTRSHPQDARKWGEGPLLAEWADAVRAGDAPRAAQPLNVARTIGRALAEVNHDMLLADVVASIDRSADDPRRLQALAEAVAVYRDGRVLYSKRSVTEAQKAFRQSAEMFARWGTPLTDVARYYIASAVFDDNRPDEALRMLRELERTIDRDRYRGLDAQIKWEISLCARARGDWAAALGAVRDARRIFAALGESMNRANMDAFHAQILGSMAQYRAAWHSWVAAFTEFSRSGWHDRLRGTVAEAIQKERAAGNYEAALALANIDAGDAPTPHISAVTAAIRARLLMSLGDAPAAAAAVRDARQNVARVADPAFRTRAAAIADVAESIVIRPSDVKRSRALLDHLAQFFVSRGDHLLLPDIYLQRGRTFLQQKDETAALADFEAGIRELTAQRANVDDGGLRSSFYDSAPDLFAEAIGLLLRRGEIDRAFAYADGARAHSLYEQIGGQEAASGVPSLASIQQALPADTALLEYAILPDSVAIFCVSRAGYQVVRVPRDSRSVREAIARFRDSLERTSAIERIHKQAVDLRSILIGSVAPKISGARHLIIVPDRELHGIPFSALYDAGTRRYLIEDYSISVAPSARFAVRRIAAPATSPALVIGDPKSDGGPALPDAVREAQAIAAMYPAATLLIAERATRARFVESAEGSAVIHYAGHAESDEADTYGVLRLAPSEDGRTTGSLDVTDISRLKLRKSPLVVLAACGTIRGEADHVEGMPSVARAFLAAGARGVVGTLWEINDDIAARLFRRVHEQILAGHTATAALRNAQVEMIRDADARLRHPSSWAPVEILGN
jgi:CHAT domain-containing protein